MPTLLTSGLVIDHLRFRVENERNLRKGMRNMSRLDEKWAKAGGVVGRVEKQIEDRLDALIARETVMQKKTGDVFDRTNAPIDDADKALDALDAKLNLLSNGGPDGPLPGSGGSLDTPEQPPLTNGSAAPAEPNHTSGATILAQPTA